MLDGMVGDESAAPPRSRLRGIGRWISRAGTVYWPLLIIFFVALLVRTWAVGVWLPECRPEQLPRESRDVCYQISGDAYYYHSMASNLSTGGGFAIDYPGTDESIMKADRPPGYVMFLAGLNILGVTEAGSHRFVLAVLGSAAAALVGLLGWRLGAASAGPNAPDRERWRRGVATGVVAGGLGAAYSGFWMGEVYYMSESLFLPFIVLTLLCAYRFWREPVLRNALLLGAAAGGAWLVRGEAALLLGLIVSSVVLFMRGVPFWRKVGLGLASCTVCIGMMVPWVLHNMSRFDEPIYIAATGTAFALNSCDDVWYGDATGWYSFHCLSRYNDATVAEDGRLTDAGLRARSTAYISENLGEYPRVATVRVGRLFGLYSNADTFHRNVLLEGRNYYALQTQQRMYYTMAVAGIAGAVVLRRRKVPISPLVCSVLAVVATVAATFPIYRYRLAADVAVMVAAAVAFVTLASWVGNRSHGRGQRPDREPSLPVTEQEDKRAVVEFVGTRNSSEHGRTSLQSA